MGMDSSYRIEKRLVLSPERCPECGRRARHMVEESHTPGYHGITLGTAPHIAREYRCVVGHRWRHASYNGTTFEWLGIDGTRAPHPPPASLQALTAGIPRLFLITGAIVFAGAIGALVLALVVLVWLVHG